MQLKHKHYLRNSLTTATCSLLSLNVCPSFAFGTKSPWEIDSAVLYYSEADRMTIAEPYIFVKKELKEDEYVSARLVFDSMTGATPNGATATNKSQTFTAPSNKTTFTTKTNDTPYVSFIDQRTALDLEWERPLDRMTRRTYGLSLSSEYDYQSLGLSANFNRDINQRLTTITIGGGLLFDSVRAIGGQPVELAVFGPAQSKKNKENDVKNHADMLVGITQVINRKTLMQLNYTYGTIDGYLTDPYKIVSRVDNNTGETLEYRYEKRPDLRKRNIVFWKTVHHFKTNVIHIGYRYYWDDWDIQSNTIDIRYRHELSSKSYIEPHIRYYNQTAAVFYRHSLTNDALPSFVSSDQRLGEFTTLTYGFRYGRPLGKTGELGIRLEIMQQNGDQHPSNAIGIQQSQDLFPTLNVTIVQFDYSFEF